MTPTVSIRDDQRPLRPAEVEQLLGLRDGQLRIWRHNGTGPPPFAHPSPRVYMYRVVDVLRWLASTGATTPAITASTTLPVDGRKERP